MKAGQCSGEGGKILRGRGGFAQVFKLTAAAAGGFDTAAADIEGQDHRVHSLTGQSVGRMTPEIKGDRNAC
jgi:hypothetical protein